MKNSAEAATAELDVVTAVQTLHPKAGAAWSHRAWILDSLAKLARGGALDNEAWRSIIAREIEACNDATKKNTEITLEASWPRFDLNARSNVGRE